MTRFFLLSRVSASTPKQAQALLAAQAEAAGYQVVRVRCHPVPWLPGEWDGTVEILPPGGGKEGLETLCCKGRGERFSRLEAKR